jgi:hypothetical protein
MGESRSPSPWALSKPAVPRASARERQRRVGRLDGSHVRAGRLARPVRRAEDHGSVPGAVLRAEHGGQGLELRTCGPRWRRSLARW